MRLHRFQRRDWGGAVELQGRLRRDPLRQAMTSVLYQSDLSKLLCAPASSRDLSFKFSIDIKTMKATDQKSSGRCWLFAAANVLREYVAKQLNLEQFELSQSYLRSGINLSAAIISSKSF